jgi:hypothetical protein
MRVVAMAAAAIAVLAGTTTIGAQVVATPSPPGSQVPAKVKPEKNTPAPRKACTLPGISAQHIQEVVDASYALQPPLASDEMIRIAAKVAAPCAAFAKDLLQRAFDQADSVEPNTSYMRARRNGTLTDTRVSYVSNAYSLQLDRLSLQSRAVIGIAPLDARKAIQLFQRMQPPRPPTASCANAFVEDVSIYYEALGKVFALLRAEKPRNDDQVQAPFLQLEEVVGATTSPVQLAPLVKVLEQADLTASQLSSLLSSVSAAVESFPVDDNSLYSDAVYPVVKAKEQLVQLAVKTHVSPVALIHSFHDYLDRSLNGPHCAGNEPKDLKDLVTLFVALNGGPVASELGVEPLSIPASAPPVESGPDDGEYWLSSKGQELLIDAKHLNFDDKWQPYTEADHKTPEWQDRVRHLLNDMDDWRPTDESDPADYYHERCMLLYRTLAYLPPGALYDRVVATWITTFAESSLQWDSPSEWYFEVARFLDFSKKEYKGSTPQTALVALKNSSNPYLHGIGILAEFLQ